MVQTFSSIGEGSTDQPFRDHEATRIRIGSFDVISLGIWRARARVLYARTVIRLMNTLELRFSSNVDSFPPLEVNELSCQSSFAVKFFFFRNFQFILRHELWKRERFLHAWLILIINVVFHIERGCSKE